MRTIIQY